MTETKESPGQATGANSTETSALGEADVIQPSIAPDRIAAANRLLDLTFPPGVEGIVAAPTGTPSAGEKYLPDWREHFFEWPAQRNALLAHIFHTVADDREVYLCGSVFNDPPAGRRRKKFTFKESWTIRVDFDGTETEEIRRRAAKLGAGTINSGTDGHLHLWVRLAEPIVNPDQYEYYWRKITGKLEVAGTEKCAAVDVLRIPGTNNHKRRVLAGGDPTPVTWDEAPADPITLAELTERLECPLWSAAAPPRNGAERHARASGSAGWGDESPIDLASHPKASALLKALTTPALKADGKPDRSTTFYNLVETAVFCGLDDAQIRWYVRQQTDVARRLEQRGPASAEDDLQECRRKAFRKFHDAWNSVHEDLALIGGRRAAPGAQAAGADARPKLWRIADLQPIRQSTFLAKQRIPYGAATILIGDEGIGKSLLWVLIVAAVTTGKPLPALGIPERAPADVMLIITEDNMAEDVQPRLEVAGADTSRIRVICTEDDGTGSPTFPDHMALITNSEIQPALDGMG